MIAPQNMRECLNNILRTDPRLAEAIDNDSDVLREMGEDEYFSLDQHDNPIRAFRAAGDPGLLPFPPDYLTQKEMWRYLGDEIEKEQIREKRSKTLTRIIYGHPIFLASFWIQRDIPWGSLKGKNPSTYSATLDYKGRGDLSSALRAIVKNVFLSKNLDWRDFVDPGMNKKVLERRKNLGRRKKQNRPVEDVAGDLDGDDDGDDGDEVEVEIEENENDDDDEDDDDEENDNEDENLNSKYTVEREVDLDSSHSLSPRSPIRRKTPDELNLALAPHLPGRTNPLRPMTRGLARTLSDQ